MTYISKSFFYLFYIENEIMCVEQEILGSRQLVSPQTAVGRKGVLMTVACGLTNCRHITA